MEAGDSEKEEVGCAPAEERQTYLFPTVPAHCPSFFSSLSPQKFVDLSNQMYIVITMPYPKTDGKNA
ncbi:hypothetical protein P9597_09055 [Aneurinibacillus migulanus]|uniref:hypothetical protein n=1 Tax=Aneurinibacillus migulanus TaxID=47500 RepID=UPI002E22ACE4|nr:hypothetical protein [Aneurinibacillus migulanus]